MQEKCQCSLCVRTTSRVSSGSSSISCVCVEEEHWMILATDNVRVKDSVTYEEIMVQMLDCQVRMLRTKVVALEETIC